MTERKSWDQEPGQTQSESEVLRNSIAKYFEHGILFAIFLPAFYFILDFLLTTEITGLDISILLTLFGLLVIFVPLLFGLVNGELARRLWGLNPKKAVTTWYGQGLLVLFMLPLFGSFYYYLFLFSYWGFFVDTTFAITIVILDALASGYVGRYVAAEFERDSEGVEELASVSDRHTICPHCGLRFMHQIAKMDLDGLVSCPHCGGKVIGQPDGPQPTGSFDGFN